MSNEKGSASVSDAGSSSQTPLVVRAVWFVLVGWWATGIWLGVAWFLIVTVIGAPFGIAMMSTTPLVVSLKRRRTRSARPSSQASQRSAGRRRISNEIVTEDGESRLESSTAEQHSILLRAVYFVLIGWWASLLWMTVAYLFTLTILGLPIAIWMYGKLPYVASLYRY